MAALITLLDGVYICSEPSVGLHSREHQYVLLCRNKAISISHRVSQTKSLEFNYGLPQAHQRPKNEYLTNSLLTLVVGSLLTQVILTIINILTRGATLAHFSQGHFSHVHIFLSTTFFMQPHQFSTSISTTTSFVEGQLCLKSSSSHSQF